MRPRVFAAAGCLLAFGACVLPARSYGAYEEKAATTAEAVSSAVSNALLAVRSADEQKAFATYVTVMLDESEQDASGAQETLGSIQPPDESSERLHDTLEPVLEQAVATISDLRVAARGGRMEELETIVQPLHDVADDLEAFLAVHG